MRLWPFNRRETRADLTDAIVSSILATATGDVAEGLTAGREIAAGHWQRAFASAEVKPAGVLADALTPHLGYVGRQLVETGEAVFAYDFTDGVQLIPASGVIVTGDPDPASWRYDLTLSGPSHTLQRRPLRPDAVLHLYYVRGARNPWKGISPIENSSTTNRLLNNLEKRLAQEAGGAVGTIIPVPNVETTGQLQADLRALKGEVTLTESTAAGWGAGQTGAPPVDFPVRRLGANPPDTLARLRRAVEESILAACGVPVSVLGGSTSSAARESYRQFLHGTIQPVADGVAAQINAQLDSDLSFDFSRLFASDLSGRARAFQSMVGGGMEVDRAAALAGLMEPGE